MYVCLCVAITDRQARAACDDGARTPGQVLRACGATRACGRCSPTILEILRESRSAADDTATEEPARTDRYEEAR